MKILIVTDAWEPQINGVVTTYKNLIKELKKRGHSIEVVSPKKYKVFPCPYYPEIKLSVPPYGLSKIIKDFSPDWIHVATEGPLGWAAVNYLNFKKIPYSTAFHTRFPEYIEKRTRIPANSIYPILKLFHKNSSAIFVPTPSIAIELEKRDFKKIVVWSRGVDRKVFNPARRKKLKYKKPIFLYAGRISVEKNIEEFLKLNLPGTKILVGDGPEMKKLTDKYPAAVFLGYKKGKKLAKYYASSDVFIFPSLTDTFGVVLIESISCGTPAVCKNVLGPKDVVNDGIDGFVGNDLEKLAKKALLLDRKIIYESSKKWTWENATNIFIKKIEEIKRI